MSKQTQHQLPAGKARIRCCMPRTHMAPAEALGSVPDSWPWQHQDPHPSLHLVSPSATIICSCSWSPPSTQSQILSPLPWITDAHLGFPQPLQLPACLSPVSAVPVWRRGGDTCAVSLLAALRQDIPGHCRALVPVPREPCTDTSIHHIVPGKAIFLMEVASGTKYSCK